jgi:hypothetical protein
MKAGLWQEAEHDDLRYVPLPRYWAPRVEVDQALGGWQAPWLLAFRDIARSTDERTLIAACLPRVGVGNNAPLLLTASQSAPRTPCLLGNISSMPFDYVARQRAAGRI